MVTAVPEVWGEGHLASWVREDWVLLRLSECEGERIGWLDLADQDDSSLLSTPIAIAGYPSDKPRSQLWRDRTGHISRIGPAAFPDCLLNSAATRSGNSGSPLYQESSSSPAVVGLQVRVRADTPQVLTTYDESQAGFAVDVRHIAKRIGGLVSADKAVFWSKRPDMAGKNPAHP
jgi:V8-like Glu-specific endopeptidase